ncbi:MAG: cyclic nucleotide-binding domain-containing protein [Bdellovibrionales bacterium]|nr:cyclic nucleotide-binding domain-containing protein [Bdellovibrionales bacterium]
MFYKTAGSLFNVIMTDLETRKTFLIVTRDKTRQELYAYVINKHIAGAQIFIAQDGVEASSKMTNVPPHIVILDYDLAKISGPQLVQLILKTKELEKTAIIITSIPSEDQYVDQVVTGKIQMLENAQKEKEFNSCLARALNFVSHGDVAEYYLRFLAPKDILIKEGETADYVYIVRKGRLRAYNLENDKDVTLGFVEAGEFVGEMAYINGESRTAHVEAVTDCELIEVPIGTLEHILFQRPSWSKALMVTLSKRLKSANKSIVAGT